MKGGHVGKFKQAKRTGSHKIDKSVDGSFIIVLDQHLGCMAVRLQGCEAARPRGCKAARLRGWTESLSIGACSKGRASVYFRTSSQYRFVQIIELFLGSNVLAYLAQVCYYFGLRLDGDARSSEME